ncbi:MAG: DUF1552 domain-containing protein, partial [Planctomycetaceae bacterium]|nr:DUF1552 domain-containing protein [Planctomycetaceae bacterium]
MTSNRTSRRRFLRGLGVTLALPWLETPKLWGRDVAEPSSPSQKQSPLRFACLFMANGVNPSDWGAEGQGTDMVLRDSLKPLEPVKDQLLVLNGLYNPNAAFGNIHVAAAPNILSGARVQQSTTDLQVGTSFDQILAKHIGSDTEFPSLALGIEPPYLGTHKGYSCIYCSHISWSSASTPVPRENNPRALYDRLVGDPRGKRQAASVLDLVLDDAKSVLPRLSSWDRQRLNDYLTSVREVEQRLNRVPSQSVRQGPKVQELIKAPATDVPPVIADHMRLMTDLLAIAFATDSTRIATLMFNNDLSKMDFGFLNSRSTALTNMHTMSHAGGKDYSLMNKFHIEMYAHLLRRLQEFPEGDKSVLDNSSILFCSSLMSGGRHDRSQMPVLLAGNLGGKLETGRTLDFKEAKDQEERRRLCNLYLKLFEHYGVERKSFGDSVEP